jgi:hypothetical protein
VIDPKTESSYLARIAELEAAVRAVKAELAAREVDATVTTDAGLGGSSFLVVADGTQGMRRGVSVDRSRSTAGAGDTVKT